MQDGEQTVSQLNWINLVNLDAVCWITSAIQKTHWIASYFYSLLNFLSTQLACSTFSFIQAYRKSMELSSIEVQQTAPYMITAILVLLLLLMLLILLQSLLHYVKVIIRGNYIYLKVRHIFINPIINVIHSNYYIMQGNGNLLLKDFHRSRLASILSAKKFTENWSVRGLSIPQLTISKFLSCELLS
jgi:hypothetical protein